MRPLALLSFLAVLPVTSAADLSTFTTGPVFTKFGPVASVNVTIPVPTDAIYRHSFDVSRPADDGALNRSLESAARFINMHVRAGVDPDHIELAIVVHGSAVRDVASGSSSTGLVAALVDFGVDIVVCGQSAAYYEVGTDDLLPGVDMAVSAMTMHALLQQQGYTLNPF